jgi:hypothetical protein
LSGGLVSAFGILGKQAFKSSAVLWVGIETCLWLLRIGGRPERQEQNSPEPWQYSRSNLSEQR